ncbi:MAG TPA: XdhC/CoxI family protein [Opitutaceae bacterium]|nr:XdhC/CoxI family protein [Opitutaceae bacterium]
MKELQNILRAAENNLGRDAVLATLVKTEGSSYRRVGARLYWRPDEPRIGSISGGCLEEDLLLKAKTVYETGKPQVVVYDTTDENDLVWGVGLGCHGIVHLTLERVSGVPLHFAELKSLWRARQAAVLATAFGDEASSVARAVGLYSESGTIFSEALQGVETLVAAPEVAANDNTATNEVSPRLAIGGGGNSQFSPESLAKRTLEAQANQYASTTIGAERVQVLFEYLPPPFCLNIFGAGDDAQPLCRVAKELGWIVRVFDPRPAFATQERFPSADEVVLYRTEFPDVSSIDRWSAAVVMTHHYRYDVPLLSAVLRSRAPYVGLLGPKKRAEKILGDLEAQGLTIDAAMRARLRAPVGLDLGSTSPEQVALSIIAEIEASLNKRDGRPLRERTRPIHG